MRLTVFILFFFYVHVNAQKITERGRQHLNVLAADDMFGRGYVKDGYKKASAYVIKEFTFFGLKPIGKTYVQNFTYPVNTFPDSVSVVVGNTRVKPGYDFIVDEASGSDHGTFLPHYFSINDFFLKFEPVFQADEVVVVDPLPAKMNKDSMAIIHARIEKFNEDVPVIQLTNEKLTWSVSSTAYAHARIELKADKFDKKASEITLNIHNVLNHSFQSSNIVGIKKAKNKKCKDYFVITAHLDHLGMMGTNATFNGANDNASGVSLLLCLAEYYAKIKPTMNIVFIAFGGEEAGLLGSKYFVENPLIPLDKIRFLLNIDLMGTGEDGITVVNATKFKDEFELLKKINANANYLKLVKPRGEAANSDHYWFTVKGVPAFFIYAMGGTTAYHDVNDRPEQLSLAEFEDLYKMIIEFFDKIQLLKK
jgi:aminopeptidase YwaD